MTDKTIKIFNNTLNIEIRIDSLCPEVFFISRHQHEDNPHVIIKLTALNFFEHADGCDDCMAFKNAFGTSDSDWHIAYFGKTNRLNVSALGSKPDENHISFEGSNDWYGTVLKLNIDIETKESLEQELKIQQALENYEECSRIFRKLNAMG